MISGLLLIDKPPGFTSFEVVRRVRRALKVKKAGHLGTLDPFATGLLPLALGEATKLAQFLLEESKVYLATLKLGEETDTQDLTGRVTGTWERLPSPEEILRAAAGFQGEIEQVPPLYSALRHQGERLYKLARRGEAVAAPPRTVVIHRLEVQDRLTCRWSPCGWPAPRGPMCAPWPRIWAGPWAAARTWPASSAWPWGPSGWRRPWAWRP
jgi:tRNA pseudouridine55 synthase